MNFWYDFTRSWLENTNAQLFEGVGVANGQRTTPSARPALHETHSTRKTGHALDKASYSVRPTMCSTKCSAHDMHMQNEVPGYMNHVFWQ